MQVAIYVEINILCMVLLGIMALSASRFELDTTRQTRTFVSAIWSAFTMNLCEFFWRFGLSGNLKLPLWLLKIINSGYFIMLCSASFFGFVFTEYIFQRKIPKTWGVRLLLAVPFVALVVLLIVNAFNGCFFTFEGEVGGTITQIRGPLYYMQHVLGLSYLLLAICLYLSRWFSRINSKHYLKKDEDKIFICFAVPWILCAVLQIFFQNLPILSVAPVIAFLLTYANVIKLQVTIDPLTGINNRRALLKTLVSKCRNVKKDSKLFFLFIDIDNFKQMNDIYGHSEGDRALQSVADSLSKVCRTWDGFCARYGGDEFAVIQELNADKNVADLCKNIETTVARRSEKAKIACPVKVSVGYAEFNKDAATAQELINFADRQMYRKKAKKSQKSL